jgi:hypothetical protein
MSGSAAISGNEATGSGGGVYVYAGTFTMNGGIISGNTTTNIFGGGVFVGGGTFTMSGSAAISGNTATGVAVFNNGTFTMEGGIISGNTAAQSGGGVYVYSGGTFTKTGGTVYGSHEPAPQANRATGDPSSAAVYANDAFQSDVKTTNKTVVAEVIQP